VVAPLSAQPLAPEPDPLWSYNTTYAVTDIATGDLNGDGKDDVVAIEYEPDTLSAISGADGSMLWEDDSIAGFAVAIGDITGDGKNEVIAGGQERLLFSPETNNSFGSTESYVINAYAANGTPLWSYPTSASVHDIEIGDVDGDGIDDVVACNVNSSAYIYVIDGDGNDLPGWPVSPAGDVVDLAIGQLDGIDGMDVAAIGQSEPATLYVYDSSGTQLWMDHDISGCTVEIGDVNGDGDNEVVAPSYGESYPPSPTSPGFGEIMFYGYVLAFDGDEGGEPLYSFFAEEWKQNHGYRTGRPGWRTRR
jgi:hypothetical protein